MEVNGVNPLVSVCIPTYNNPDGLRKTLDCITGQSYKDLEIIVSDNCSPDPRVQEVIQEYKKKDGRIKAYRQLLWINVNENYRFVRGKATGKYMMFAQDDDWWSERFIERLVDGLEQHPEYPAAISNTRYVMADGTQSPVYDMTTISPYWAIGNGKVGMVCMGLWRREKYSAYEAILDVKILGGDHITAAHAMMAHGGIYVCQTEEYRKGFRKGGMVFCFSYDFWHSFRTWYWLVRTLVQSPHIPARRKLLVPVAAITNFVRVCAVTGVEVVLALPDNPVKRMVQKRFFGAN